MDTYVIAYVNFDDGRSDYPETEYFDTIVKIMAWVNEKYKDETISSYGITVLRK